MRRTAASALYGFICTVLAAFLTAFYSWRLLFMTFHGKPRADHHVMEHVHESPAVMMVPLLVLAVGALCAGFVLHALVHRRGLAGVLERQHLQRRRAITCWPAWSMCRAGSMPRRRWSGWLGIAIGLCDVYGATRCCRCGSPQTFRPIYLFLLNKWYFDELYDALLVQPRSALARALWQTGDATVIDGVPNGLAALTTDGSREVVKMQTGSLAVYAFAMLIGVVVLVGIFLLFR